MAEKNQAAGQPVAPKGATTDPTETEKLKTELADLRAALDEALAPKPFSLADIIGTPTFSRPERRIMTKNNKSELICRVHVPLAGMFEMECTCWLERITREGYVEEVTSVTLPQNLKPLEEHKIAIETWRRDLAKEGSPLDNFLYGGKAVSASAGIADTGRLVKRIPLAAK